MKAWKEFEALGAKLFKTKREWANSGGKWDFVGVLGDMDVYGQSKLVKQLPLNALTRLIEGLQLGKDMEITPVCVKVRRGQGNQSEPLVVLSFSDFEKIVAMVDFFLGPILESKKPKPTRRKRGLSSQDGGNIQ